MATAPELLQVVSRITNILRRAEREAESIRLLLVLFSEKEVPNEYVLRLRAIEESVQAAHANLADVHRGAGVEANR